jgi:hypothetical protein
MIMFLRSVIADLEKRGDREGVAIAAPEMPAARKQRKARMPRAIMKRAAGRQRRATRVSAHRSARASRVRHRNVQD